MKKIVLTVCSVFLFIGVYAQVNVTLKINHALNDHAFSFSQEATNNLDVKFNVKRLQYYISKISIVHDNGKITEAKDVYYLANANENAEIELGEYNITDVEAINFSVGVNSPENNQDPSQWPTTHALYPKSPSMHWGWASGYRFVAMEGYGGDMLNRRYEIHALGNENYHKISIPTSAISDTSGLSIEINADYARAVENIELAKGLVVHGSTNQAAELLRNFRDYVFTNADGNGNTLSTEFPLLNNSVVFYPNPSIDGVFTVESTGSSRINAIRVSSMSGDVLIESTGIEWGVKTFSIEASGIFMVEVFYEDNTREIRKLVRI